MFDKIKIVLLSLFFIGCSLYVIVKSSSEILGGNILNYEDFIARVINLKPTTVFIRNNQVWFLHSAGRRMPVVKWSTVIENKDPLLKFMEQHNIKINSDPSFYYTYVNLLIAIPELFFSIFILIMSVLKLRTLKNNR